MTESDVQYKAFFRAAFNNDPFDYQCRLATSETLFSLVNVPTGAGKTAAILGAWLWRRLQTPTQRVRVSQRRKPCFRGSVSWVVALGIEPPHDPSPSERAVRYL